MSVEENTSSVLSMKSESDYNDSDYTNDPNPDYTNGCNDNIDTRIKQLDAVQSEARSLFRKKNTDYGDAFATYGTVGILVRLGDKIHRLQSITSNGINLVEDEKIRDTLLDLHNYAAMGIMLLDNATDNVYNNKDELILEENNELSHKWHIEGSSGNIYIRENITYPNGTIIRICSCPSFKYCSDVNKKCKHTIKQPYLTF